MYQEGTWYALHRDSERERVKKWKIDNKERFYKYNTEYRKRDDRAYKSYFKEAIRRNLIFEIDLDYFKTFKDKNCKYCGDKINGYGIDRIDNAIGYTIENTIPCCGICNLMKYTHTVEKFLNHCKKITKFNK